ncbi:MAG: hypothetical protein GY710_17825 [Desulfobacteraceae bacterium]|nr:hypothetical protein [Desulfobacteraceae bacterium]
MYQTASKHRCKLMGSMPILIFLLLLGFQNSVFAESDTGETQEIIAQDEIDKKEKSKLKTAKSLDASITSTQKGTGDTSTQVSSSTVNTSLFTGAATAAIPILIPPGRAGMQPKIALNYNSYQKNGWMGMGWDISMGAIQRSTKRGVDYTANDYEVAMGGNSKLVPRDDWGENFYGAKIEGRFTKYSYDTEKKTWEAMDKSGLKYFFGRTPASRQDDPKDASRIFKWCLDTVIDTNGNYMTISYTKDQGQIYLSNIKYAGHAMASKINSVKFCLDDGTRTDAFPMYTTKTKIKTSYRLKAIETYANRQLVRKYQLNYGYGTSTGRSHLKTIQLFGSDGKSSLNLARIDWNDSNGDLYTTPHNVLSNLANEYPVASGGDNIGSDNIFTVKSPDINGDGMADICWRGDSGLWSALSNGDGTFAPAQMALSNLGNGVHPSNGGNSDHDKIATIRYPDLNGDGMADVCWRGYSGLWIALSKGDGTFAPPQMALWNLKNGVPESDGGDNNHVNIPTIQFPDINGDGLPDICWRGNSGLWSALSKGDGTFTEAKMALWNLKDSAPQSDGGNNDTDNIPTIRYPDLNGDGMADVCWRGDFGLWIALSKGDGTFAEPQKVLEKNLETGAHKLNGGNNDHNNISTIQFPDINGDGLPDICWRGDSGLWSALSKGDGTFAEAKMALWNLKDNAPQSDGGNNDTDNIPTIRYPDLNGDGMADVCWRGDLGLWIALSKGDGTFAKAQKVLGENLKNSAPASNGGNNDHDNIPTIQFPDINGDGLPDICWRGDSGLWSALSTVNPFVDLVTVIQNGYGGKTTIQYTPSSQYKNKLLPYVIHTISEITTYDGRGNTSTTTYNYAGGLYNRSDKDFRGFETVTQTNPDGTKIETKFLQGEFDKGRQYQEELRDPSNKLLSKSTMDWVTYYPDEMDDQEEISDTYGFVKLLCQRTEIYDNGTSFTQEDYTYDNENGNLLTSIASGTGGESITAANTYENFGSWVWRMTSTALSGSTSGQSRYTENNYETDTGNLLSTTLGLDGANDPITLVTYDEFGNPKTRKDPLGNITTTYYDRATHTFPVRVEYPETNGVSHVVKTTLIDYKFGKPLKTEDENGNRISYTYDAFGRLIRTDLPNGGQTITEYNDTASPRHVTSRIKANSSGATIDSITYMDGFNRAIQSSSLGENGRYITTRNYYDNMGRTSLSEGPFYASDTSYPQEAPSDSPWGSTSFDYFGRPVLTQVPDGTHGTINIKWSYSGLSTTIVDPDNGSKTETRDYLGKIIQIVEHGDNARDYQTNYTYNVAGDLLSVQDNYDNLTTMEYDSLGRKIAIIDPDMGSWYYTYDANGNMLTQTDAKNQTTSFKYDDLNRVLSKTYSTNDPGVFYTYDNLNITNGRGQLYQTTNDDVTITIDGFDSVENILSETKTITGAPDSYTTSYSYDLTGRPSTTTYPDRFSVTNTYMDGTSLLKQITGSDDVIYAQMSNYTPQGKIGRIDYGNYTYTQYDYDNLSGRLMSIMTERLGPTQTIQERSYEYTPGGNIAGITDNKNGTIYSYTYDMLHRLTGETSTGNTPALNYRYDAIGNILSKTLGADTMTYKYGGFSPHAVSAIRLSGKIHNYIYDANGNMTTGPDFTDPLLPGSRNITYNIDNMPVKVQHIRDGVTKAMDLVYDGYGARAVKNVTGGPSTFYVGGHFQVTKNDAATETTRFIFAGNMRVAQAKNGVTHYFHKDHLGSSTAMSDDSGATLETSEYLPYGGQRSHTGSNISNYRFTDQELDPESGLYNYNARLYDPVIGKFITADIIVPDPTNPQTLNRYSYCGNNPLIYVDPSGHIFGIDDILIGAIIGGIIAGSQSDWDLKTILAGGVIGGISGGIFSGVQGAVSSMIGNSIVGGAISGGVGGFAAGSAAGGLSAACYGGNVMDGILTGGKYAAIGGAAFGGINGHFGDRWDLWRISANTIAGGYVNEISDGNFAKGAIIAGGTALAYWAYTAVPNTGKPSLKIGQGPQANKYHGTPCEPGKATVGLTNTKVSGWTKYILAEGQGLMQAIEYLVVGATPFGRWHDHFLNLFPESHLFNQPGMAQLSWGIAAPVSYGALLYGHDYLLYPMMNDKM